MQVTGRRHWGKRIAGLLLAAAVSWAGPAVATPFTTVVPSTGVALPPEYPEAGGVAIVLTGANGNIYYQFSDPSGAFVGFQLRGQPRAFRGNPFTINDPIGLDCGFRSCADYFGGTIARVDIRFTAYDGDTQQGGFDEDDITLVMNGFDVGSWSGLTTEITNTNGTQGFGFQDGFGNNTTNTGWFSSTNPALLNNILSTGQTTTQVRDDDPNDNYWDFTRGESLGNTDIQTIAPGYELTKVRRGGDSTFLAVGQQITYDYSVANIGSVNIFDIEVEDDKIGTVTCSPTTLPLTAAGQPAPATATCSAVYTVTQEDVDAGELTNIAVATGRPEFGQLGQLEAEVTLTGPVQNPDMTLTKSASPSTFRSAGEVITYTLTVANTGNVTLSNIAVTDPMLSGFSCSAATIAPLSADNTDNTLTCTGTYTVTQDDVNDAAAGTQLENTANATARDPDNTQLAESATETVTGPASLPAMALTKVADTANFDAVGDVLTFRIVVDNTGNVTWPTGPTVTDDTADTVSCPTTPVDPGQTATCTATYTVDQDDIDNGSVTNTATGTVTVAGVTASETDTATVPAVQNPEMTVAKSLSSGPDPFSAVGDALVYEYLLTNTGNVRLDSVALTDDLVSLTCPATTIPAGGTLTCTSDPYIIDQDDLNVGSVTNTATANAASPDGTAAPQVTDDLTINADQLPALTMAKTGALDGSFLTGQTISYDYLVTNTGNVELPGPFTVNDNKFTDPITCPAGALAPGDAVTCSASYVITAADSTAGFVNNTASATDGTTTSNTDTETVAVTGTPSLSLTKTATEPSFDSITDTITYTYVITNTGDRDLDLNGVSSTAIITDDKIASVDCAPLPAALLQTNSLTCIATYAVTQPDIDAGAVTNMATATLPASGTDVTSNEATETVPADITPAFTFAKTAVPSTFGDVGDVITYTFTVTNQTEQTLASVDVTDPLLGGDVCTITNIGPAPATGSCTGTYSTTQDDLDAGDVVNTATATGRSATGAPIAPVTATETINADGTVLPSFTVAKSADTLAYAAVGDMINYTIAVNNDGKVTLTGLVVTDAALGLTCNLAPLAPGDTDNSCRGSYTVDQDDIDTGTFDNIASATYTPATGPAITETGTATATGPAAAPNYTFSKTADTTFTAEGDVINFTLSFTNTGNVRLFSVSASDGLPLFSPTQTCAFGTVDPGDTVSCQLPYTVTQDDVDAGEISNTADVTATPPSGPAIPGTADETVAGPAEAPGITVDKTAAGNPTSFALNDLLTYNFTVTNTGNVTLENIVIDDPRVSFNCAIAPLPPGQSTTQCADTSPLTASLIVGQPEVDFGAITNTVSVTAETTQGTPTDDTDEITLTGPVQAPALSVAKSSPTPSFANVGDTITYSYVVTNTGNITITSPITVDDDRTTVTCLANPGIAPGGTLTCSATDTVTQDDLDNGFVTNTATAATTQPVVPSPLYPDGTAAVTSPTASETVNGTRSPALDITKAVAAGSASTYEAVGDQITFQFTVRNTGNVRLTAPFTVSDPDVGAPFDCGTGTVEPGDTVTCTAIWTADQTDIDNGSFTNSATASTTFAGNPVSTPTPAEVTVNAIQQPAMELVKAFNNIVPNVYAENSVITYDFTVANTGNQTIAGPIQIVDPLIPTFTCLAGDLAPTDPPITCQGTYTVTADDVTFGSVTNSAIASSATVDSPPSSETVPVDADPAIDITKVADVADFDAVGDVITYTYTVTNTSPGTSGIRPSILRNIFINDDKIAGAIQCFDPNTDNASADTTSTGIDPDEEFTCTETAQYTITQDDLDAVAAGGTAGFVTNNATGEIQPAAPGQSAIGSSPVSVTVPAAPIRLLTVDKVVSAAPTPTRKGDTISYTIIVTNDGNETISGLALADPLIEDLDCLFNGAATPATLAPTQQAVCTGDYVVTQDDIDAGQDIENTVDVSGNTPTGQVVTGDDSATHPLDAPAPAVTLVKELAEGEPTSAFSAIGQQVPFQITVTNSGNVTLASTTVTDSLFPGESCLIGPLSPGDVDTSCVFIYTVSQDDLDAGSVTNLAEAAAVYEQPGEPPVTVDDDDAITGAGPDREPDVTVTKEALTATYDDDNDTLDYRYVVANTGNVTLTFANAASVSDDLIPLLSCGVTFPAELEPDAFFTCTGTYDVEQNDVDVGSVTNVVTATAFETNQPAIIVSDTATATVDATRNPDFSVTKVASDDTEVTEGQIITYTYTVTNTGNVTLTNFALTDSHTSASGTTNLAISGGGTVTTLAPGAFATLTATYTVTQDDIDAGADLTNTVTVSATDPNDPSDPADQTATEVVDVEDADPAIESVKTVSGPASVSEGDTVEFVITVSNTGNVTLDNVNLNDLLRRDDGTLITPSVPVFDSTTDAGSDGLLSVGEAWIYRLTYTVQQADIDAGGISNQAFVTANPPTGPPVDDPSSPTSGGNSPTAFPITPEPGIAGFKSITAGPTIVDGLVRFEILVLNTGNVTLNGVTVNDNELRRADGTSLTLTSGPTFFAADGGSGEGTLAPNETATYRATYRLTQQDIDAGGIDNRATVAGSDPTGTTVDDLTDSDNPADGPANSDRITLTVPANPSLGLTKALTAGGPTFDTDGAPLTFTFTVENTGNVTITDPISITDPLITGDGGTITCDAVPLAPGATLTCSGIYTVDQDDIDAGSVSNTATATDGNVTSAPATATVPAQQNPAASVDKQAVSITPPGGATSTTIDPALFVTDAVITYEYTVVNTGNTTLNGPVTVDDNLIPGGVTCPANPGLAPGDPLTCTASYTVTSADITVGSTTNVATATVDGTTSPPDTVTVPTGATPGLSISKTLLRVEDSGGSDKGTSFDTLGDALVYEFTVTNTGNATFNADIVVNDPQLDAPGSVVCFTSTPGDPDFRPAAPGFAAEVVTCEGRKTIDQDDLDAAEVLNSATAETTFGPTPGTPVSSPSATETTPAVANPELTIVKTSDAVGDLVEGQTVTYTLTVTNTGNQTIDNIVADDPLLGAGFICDIGTLAPTSFDTCTGSYLVTQDDIDAGELINTASVAGTDPRGAAVIDSAGLNLMGEPGDPSFTMTKMAMPDPFGAVGSGVTYEFAVTNTGNVTLFDLTITDAITTPPFTCTIPRLNVGATDDASCAFSYAVTQDDKDAGEIANSASAVASDPFGTDATATAAVTIVAEPAQPGLNVVKTSSAPDTLLDTPITYTLILTNTGDVTLDIDSITDTMTRRNAASTPTSLDTPFGGLTGDTDGDGRLDVTETWTYTATHVITQADIDAGGVDNTVLVTATDPFGTPVQDRSDNGDDTDGNTEDDPTSFVIVPGPAIELVKTITQSGALPGDAVIYELVATNRGNTTLTDISLTDTLTRTDTAGTVVATDPPVVIAPDPLPASFLPGETVTWQLTHVLTQDDIDAGGLMNTASVDAVGPGNTPVSDISDNGDDTDGNTVDDPTGLLFVAAPGLELTKTAIPFADPDTPVVAGDVVTFTITTENTGNLTLFDLAITDTLTNFDGDALTPDSVDFTDGDDETTLAPGAVNTYTVLYTLTQTDIDSGGVENVADGAAIDPFGDPITDRADDGDDDDGNTEDDPTRLSINQIASIDVTKETTTPELVGTNLYDVTFTITVTNTGNITQENLSIVDDLVAFTTPAELISTTQPQAEGFATGGRNANFDGAADTNLVRAGTSLAPDATGTITITVRYETSQGFPGQGNVVAVTSDSIDTAVTAEVEIPRVAAPDIFASKSVAPEEVLRGATVTYTLTFENRLAQQEDGLTAVDLMPSGVLYTPGTAQLDGVDLSDPAITGNRLAWSGLSIGPLETINLTFDARVVSDDFEMVNQSFMLGPDGDVVSNTAEATLIRLPEPVFECADIIGKVFDDVNGNGYQDGVVEPERSPLVTDQTFDAGKAGKLNAPEIVTPDAEPGIPGVRLATVNGTLITTDAYGRFSVPCAELPASIGSNFTLKLDDRTLPTGYAVTTENPRTIRVTPGTLAKLNFGASLGNVVDIDLMAAAFQSGGTAPSAALAAGVDQLVAQLRDAPAVLNLNYYRNGESRETARARLDAAEALIRDRWPNNALRIVRAIRQVQ